MNRNIITESNAERYRATVPVVVESDSAPGEEPDPFLFGGSKGGREAGKTIPSGKPKPKAVALPAPPPPDRWYERLLKYIPVESIGLYLAVEGIVKSASLSRNELRVYLGLTLLVTLLFTWLYLLRVAGVELISQLIISCIALIVWVFALGGVFATFSYYKPWQGTVALVVAAAFLGFVKPPELEKNEPAPAGGG
jgi:hypothetical protein